MSIRPTTTAANELGTPPAARPGLSVPSSSATAYAPVGQPPVASPVVQSGTEVVPFNAPSVRDFAAVLGTYTDTQPPATPAAAHPMATNLANPGTQVGTPPSNSVAASISGSTPVSRPSVPTTTPTFVDPQLAQALNKQTVTSAATLIPSSQQVQAGYGVATPNASASVTPQTTQAITNAQPLPTPALGSGVGTTTAPTVLGTVTAGGVALPSLPAGATIAYVPVVVMPVAINGQQAAPGVGSSYLAGLPAGSVLLAPGTAYATAATATTSQAVGTVAGTNTLSLPFSGSYDVTQPFGPTIFSAEPTYHGYAHFHTGVDYALPEDTPVLAAADGTVEFAGHDTTGFGTMVMIRHADGTETLYGHLHDASVAVGTPVLRGQQIGLSGNTGNSTGPHLHFGVRQNGEWVDPQTVLPTTTAATQVAQPGLMVAGSHTTPGSVSPTLAAGGGTLNSTTANTTNDVPSSLAGIISAAARRYGVDPALVQAVIRVESNFNPNAVSPAGAQGLMQLTPTTAHSLGVTNAFDPGQGVQGVAYLRQLLDKFGGNVPLAVAAYNAGPTAVTQYGGIPPYPETRHYVQRVLDYRNQYAAQEAYQATNSATSSP